MMALLRNTFTEDIYCTHMVVDGEDYLIHNYADTLGMEEYSSFLLEK